MTNVEMAIDELWMALSEVMLSLKDSGADERALAIANKHMRKAHEYLGDDTQETPTT